MNSIRSAKSPNFARARTRSRAWPTTADTSSGECPALRSRETVRATSSVDSTGVELVEQPQSLGREQRGQLGQVHPVSLCGVPGSGVGRR